MNSSRNLFKLATGAIAVAGVLSVARADWDPGDPAKWVQLPDLSPNGLDVWDTTPYSSGGVPQSYGKFLADDFPCTGSGPITGIHIWGSWLNNVVDPAPTFGLAIYSDVPAGPAPSHPGELLWWTPLSLLPPAQIPTQQRPYSGGVIESFYDPNLPSVELGSDNEIWQYNFVFPEGEAFYQTEGNIYWLLVTYVKPDPAAPFAFGWKTRDFYEGHFSDDAVWVDWDANQFPEMNAPWQELRYPSWSPYSGESLDLSFVIVAEPNAALAGGLALLGLAGWRITRARRTGPSVH